MELDYKVYDERIVYLTSASRDPTDEIYDAEYTIEPYIFDINEDEKIEIQLQTFTCKYTFYNIQNDKNSEVDISINNGGSFTSKSLPEGNYNTKELALNIRTILREVTGDNILVAWDRNKMKYTFTQDTVLLTNIVLRFPARSTGYDLYGISKTQLSINPDGTQQVNLGNVLVNNQSPYIISIGNEESIYLHANFSNNKNISVLENKQAEDLVYAKIHIIAPFFGNIYYAASTENIYTSHFPVGIKPSNKFRFSIRDERGNLVKLQNDYQLTLRVKKFKKYFTEEADLLNKLLKLEMTKLIKKK